MSQVTPSVQDYLKALLVLSKDGGPVHSADVADAVCVSRASVSRAMGVLKELGYVKKEKYGTIMLTPLGEKTAQTVQKRNALLRVFLRDVLGVDDASAKTDACRMEHTISEQTAEKLEQFIELYGDG